MAENTKIKFEYLQELVKYCDDTLDSLDELRDRLIKIIEAKKKLSVGANNNQDILNSIPNLEKINLKLSSATDEIKKISHQIQLTSQPVTEQALLVLHEINGVLTTGDWECSIFLKASAIKLKELKTKIERLSHLGEQAQVSIVVDKAIQQRTVPPGYSQIFILLYQVPINLNALHLNNRLQCN